MVKKQGQRHLDFEIDKLTESIEHVETGESHATSVIPVTSADLALTLKKNGWVFNWRKESKEPKRQVYKLISLKEPSLIQGLVCIEIRSDHVRMQLVESAPMNRGKEKKYSGVLGNLVAFACQVSFHQGFEGNLTFLSKTNLIDHYVKVLGAFHAGRGLMIIEDNAAKILVLKYFKEI
jgi:hypothetical protein